MQVKVAYLSRKGNTKRLAHTIAKTLDTQELPLAAAQFKEPIDLLFVGGPIHASKIDAALNQYICSLDPALVKRVAVFGTSATGMTSQKEIERLLEPKGIPMVGIFFCRGEFLMVNRGRPNAQDLQQAAEFARQMLAEAASETA